MIPLKIYELETAFAAMLKYYKSGNRQDLAVAQAEIIHSMEIDYAVKTQPENDSKEENAFIEESHGPNRMLVMLANYYGEQYCNGNTIIIYDDDPKPGKANHHNKYIFKLKDPETHKAIYPGNPTKKDKPYDFDLEFIQQVTVYADGNQVDTTDRAYDSFANCYQETVRTLDFKSAFWKDDHKHAVNYIFTIGFNGELKLLDAKTNEEKQFTFGDLGTKYFLEKYLETLQLIKSEKFKHFSWREFILG